MSMTEFITKLEKKHNRSISEFDQDVWNEVTEKETFSEEFIRIYQHKLNWRYVAVFQNLSESFIEEFSAKLDWNLVSVYQKLSEDFMRKHKNKIDWLIITQTQVLSYEFIVENIEKFYDLRHLTSKWNIALTDEQKEELQKMKQLQESF